jgi:hypothetical protein
MKNIFTHTAFCLSLLAPCLTAVAQPIITSSSTNPAVGTSDSLYMSASAMSPGGGGAGVTWNFSTLPLTFAGMINIVNPSASPYASTFPSANFVMQMSVGASTVYDYNRNSSVGMETFASTYAGTGTGYDFTPNPRLSIPFPFHYLDSKTDTFQSLGSSTQDTVRLTYDGYGTLILPWKTYSNVIRVKEEYGGTDYKYAWYTVSPLMLVFGWDNGASNPFHYISEAATPTAVANISGSANVAVYPNPFTSNTVLRITSTADFSNTVLLLTDIAGKTVKQQLITGEETNIDRDGLSPGIYFYKVINSGVTIALGKLSIQ